MRVRHRLGAIVLASAIAIPAGGAPSRTGVDAAEERVIHVTAKRFSYEPSEIAVRQGEPVVLEIESLDREHGFHLPELHLRATIPPGQVTRIPLVADRKGR